ncbi:MAG: hypothetical protein ACRD2J_12635 [Thermoanaerobaculia bacterium]
MRSAVLAVAILIVACGPPPELTEEIAREVLRESVFEVEPAYAEVPQAVRWSAESSKDEYDEKTLRTLANLERAGLVEIEEAVSPEGEHVVRARTTPEGFRILGTVPSARGPAFRARIAEKRVTGIANFVRHPSQPTVGRAEVVWTYENPTRFYEMFETKIDKPLGEPFATIVSIHWENGSWNLRVLAEKVKVES